MNKNQKGFTLVELIVVIVIIGILSSIGVYSYTRSQSVARDSQRSSQIDIIAEALEKYYAQNGEYPSCADMTASSETVVTNTLEDISRDVLSTPSSDSGTNSFICSNPTADNFGYIGGGDEYTLEYLSEVTKTTVSVNSVHAPLKIEVPSTPSLSITDSSLYVTATISAATCTIGTAQYGIRSRINDGAWSDYSVWNISTTKKVKSEGTYGYKFDFQAQARCYTDNTTYSDAVISAEQTYIKPFITPSAPTVSNSTYGSTTTWSWPDVTCYHGTANYQYDYSTTYGYDSGWINKGTDLSITFTTATGGETYTVAVQANCSSAYTTSDWSTSGSAAWYMHTGLLTAMSTPTVATGNSPKGITISADGTSVYVANSGSSNISMYSRDTSTGILTALSTPTVTSTIPYDIVVSTDGASAYAVSQNKNTISMYNRDAITGILTAMTTPTINTSTGPHAVVISPDGNSVYTANYTASNISMFSRNTSTGVLTALATPTITTGYNSSGPYGIIISADGKSVYTANRNTNTISMFSRDTSTGALTALSPSTISANAHPEGIAISPDGSSVYVANGLSNTVSMFSRDTSTGALTALATPNISTPTPMAVAVSPDGASTYVANGSSVNVYTVSMFNRNIGTGILTALPTPTIALGGADPVDLAISPDGNSVYVVNTTYGTISMFTRN